MTASRCLATRRRSKNGLAGSIGSADRSPAPSTFDLWRQLTVEHLIGEPQGGYLRRLAATIPGLGAIALAELAGHIDAANTVTACSFCNSMTSRNQARWR